MRCVNAAKFRGFVPRLGPLSSPCHCETCARVSRRGFTLVELFVVIGIITVLIGILIPMASQVRERARIVVCLNNLRQIHAATIMYANAHDSLMPGMVTMAAPAPLSNPWWSYVAWGSGPGGNYTDPGVAGYLMDSGTVTTPGIFYCQGFQFYTNWTYETLKDSFAPKATRRYPAGDNKIRTNYNLLPYPRRDASGNYVVGMRFEHLSQYHSRYVLGLDVLNPVGGIYAYSHFSQGKGGFNVAFIDGSAQFLPGNDAVKTGQAFPSTPTNDPSYNWGWYMAMLRALAGTEVDPDAS